MTYNRTNIMKKAHSLRKAYNMSKSESLRKSWMMAKLEILENELFVCEMKDLDGGKTNSIAQYQISKNREAMEELQARISEIKVQLYPRVTKTHTYDKLGKSTRKLMTESLNRIARMFGTDSENYYNMAQKLADGYETYTSEALDETAYDKVA